MFKEQSQEFVYIRTYSRWIDSLNRRETWEETVDRYVNFMEKRFKGQIPEKVFHKMKQYILSLEVMPSMRALWAAGEAAERDNTVMYNCAFAAIEDVESFSECLFVLMCGTGYGFSVEEKYTNKLPVIKHLTSQGNGTILIPDSKEGWADSVKQLMYSLYDGKDLNFDYSALRSKGAKLKTMGGRSSGPEPLIILHSFIREMFAKAQGRRLTPLECHDILNQIAEIVVVGGVRRSSQISLSDLHNEEMRNAKVGNFPLRRYMANNSAVYLEKPSAVDFLQEWAALAASGSGERGISNLGTARENAPKRRKSELIQGFNPCHEVALRSNEFCNLSEVVIRADDDLDDLLSKVETATWIGILQSSYTHFPYLRSKWKENCDEERLLGVSLTGQMDNPRIMTPDNLIAMKKKAIKIAQKASKTIGINMPAAITLGKPSGSVSQVVNSSSGCHVRYSPFYIRRYRISSTDPLCQMMRDQGVPFSPEVGQRPHEVENWDESKVKTWVLEFPIKSPDMAITRHDFNAIDQLEHYKTVQSNWCEHAQSCTIYVKDSEWFDVGNWVYKNWDIINGVSFLPYDGGVYELAPYEEIAKEQYEALAAKFPKIDYSQLTRYELQDHTEGAKSYACTGDKCEIP